MAELEPSRLDVALCNHAGAVGVPGDLTKTWREVVDRWRETRPDAAPSLLAACPPCQGMSTARRGRGAEDDPDADGSRDSRNLLVLPIAHIAGELAPTFVVVENVALAAFGLAPLDAAAPETASGSSLRTLLLEISRDARRRGLTPKILQSILDEK